VSEICVHLGLVSEICVHLGLVSERSCALWSRQLKVGSHVLSSQPRSLVTTSLSTHDMPHATHMCLPDPKRLGRSHKFQFPFKILTCPLPPGGRSLKSQHLICTYLALQIRKRETVCFCLKHKPKHNLPTITNTMKRDSNQMNRGCIFNTLHIHKVYGESLLAVQYDVGWRCALQLVQLSMSWYKSACASPIMRHAGL
jgi:hypothetical protein